MKKALVLIFVLSILGVNHVSSQSNNNNLNTLLTLAAGGVAGWFANKHVQRNRRQDAINEVLLRRSFGGYFDRPYYNRFGGGFGSGFGGGFGGAPWYGSGGGIF